MTAIEIAHQRADELVAAGAAAVVLVGSHARGEASAESDLDLLAIGNGRYDCRLEVRDGLLVSVSVQPLVEFRLDFEKPGRICASVPGWREARILSDASGSAASLVEEARLWNWEPISKRCDEWVAEEIVGNAEEVHKLVAALGNLPVAAVQRSLLALHMAPILAVHHRILYGSENRLWNLVSEAMGEEWARAQSLALGLEDEPFDKSCLAALELYRLAAFEVRELFDTRQRRVVERACNLSHSASL